jgi:hypothetical protein
MDFMNQSGHRYQKRAEYGLKLEGLPGKSYETTNSWNSEPQNLEGWNRFAQSFLK